jgi:hypothetical protein
MARSIAICLGATAVMAVAISTARCARACVCVCVCVTLPVPASADERRAAAANEGRVGLCRWLCGRSLADPVLTSGVVGGTLQLRHFSAQKGVHTMLCYHNTVFVCTYGTLPIAIVCACALIRHPAIALSAITCPTATTSAGPAAPVGGTLLCAQQLHRPLEPRRSAGSARYCVRLRSCDAACPAHAT